MRRRTMALSVVLALGSLAAAEEKYFDADGVRIRYTVEGSGDPVVLIHGFLANAEVNWRMPGVTPKLAQNYRVIAMDVRGHGRSDKPHERQAYGREMALDVIRLLDHLDIPKAHVVGYSMGGFITMKLLVEHPERLLSATLGGSGGVREDYVHVWNDSMARRLEEGQTLSDALKATLPKGETTDDGELSMLQLLVKDQDSKALAAVLRSWHDLTVTYAALKDNKVPTLVIYGGNEQLFVRSYIASLEGRLGNSQFKVVDGVGHLTAMASPQFAEAILDFIKANEKNRRKELEAVTQ